MFKNVAKIMLKNYKHENENSAICGKKENLFTHHQVLDTVLFVGMGVCTDVRFINILWCISWAYELESLSALAPEKSI